MLDRQRYGNYLSLCLFTVLVWILSPQHIIDHDIWFELIGGKLFLQQPHFPFVDEFSYVTAGKVWVNQEWIAEILFFLVYQGAGLGGLVVLKALVVTATFIILFKWLQGRKADPYVIFWVLFGALVLCRFRLNVRPHIFSDFLFTVLFLMLLDKHRTTKGYIIYLAPLFMCLWTNIHFGSMIGFYLMAAYLLGYLIIFVVPSLLKKETEAFAKNRFFHLTAALFLSGVAVMLNPAGKAIFDLSDVMLEYGHKLQVLEILPPMVFGYWFFPLYWCLVLLYLIILLFNVRNADVFDLMLFGIGFALSFFMMRFIPLFAILSAPLMTSLITQAIDKKGVLYRLVALVKRPLVTTALSLAIAVGVVTSRTGYLDQLRYGFGAHPKHPFEAIQFMADNTIDGNVFNDIKYGGQILFKRFPHNKIFLYGRYSIGDVTLIDDYFALLRGEPGWREWFDHYNVNIVFLGSVLAQGSPLIVELGHDPDWALIYSDADALVFVRNIPEFADVIKKYKYEFHFETNCPVTREKYHMDK